MGGWFVDMGQEPHYWLLIGFERGPLELFPNCRGTSSREISNQDLMECKQWQPFHASSLNRF